MPKYTPKLRHDSVACSFFLTMILCLCLSACQQQNKQQAEETPNKLDQQLVDSLITGFVTPPEEACVDIPISKNKKDTVTIAMQTKVAVAREDMDRQKPVQMPNSETAEVVADTLLDLAKPEKGEALVAKAKSPLADTLQRKLLMLTNDQLSSMQKMAVIKDLSNQFADKGAESVSGKFVDSGPGKYSITEYLRRIRMTGAFDVHVADVTTNSEGKIEKIVVEERRE